MLKIFLSWSGERSLHVATALRDWLPFLLPSVKPWLSSTDIEKGARWATDVARELDQTSLGIICLTRENLKNPWILFEAGALSKSQSVAFVCTYLLELEPNDVGQPLGQFQATRATKTDTRELLGTLNRALGEDQVTDERLDRVFTKWWPDLEELLRAAPPPTDVKQSKSSPQRSEREVLEEILAFVRSQERRLSSLETSQSIRIWSPTEGSEVKNLHIFPFFDKLPEGRRRDLMDRILKLLVDYEAPTVEHISPAPKRLSSTPDTSPPPKGEDQT